MQIVTEKQLFACVLSGPPIVPDRPVVVFLHGWGRTMSDFDDLKERLASVLPSYTFLQVDLPGFGSSPLSEKQGLALDDYSRLLRALFDKLGVDKTVLVGHSFGAAIALTYAALFPASVEQLVLISAAGIRRKGFQHWILTAGRFLFRGIFFGFRDFRFTLRLKNLLGMFFGSEDYRPTHGALRNTFKKVVAEDLRAIAERIETPTLLIWGTRDAETPLLDGRTYHALIRGSRLEVLEGGHFPMLEKPTECARLIASFLEPHTSISNNEHATALWGEHA